MESNIVSQSRSSTTVFNAENKRRVRILVEWEPDSHMDSVRDMWIRQNGKWECLNVEYGGVWGGGKDVGFHWIN